MFNAFFLFRREIKEQSKANPGADFTQL